MCNHHTCHKVRCKLYGIVSGLKSESVAHFACDGEGLSCKVTKKNRHVVERDFGNDFSTLGSYFKLLGRALKARILGGDMPTSFNS